jgi:hypothetical protein
VRDIIKNSCRPYTLLEIVLYWENTYIHIEVIEPSPSVQEVRDIVKKSSVREIGIDTRDSELGPLGPSWARHFMAGAGRSEFAEGALQFRAWRLACLSSLLRTYSTRTAKCRPLQSVEQEWVS